MQVFVKDHHGRTFVIDIESSRLVPDFKLKLQDVTGVAPFEQQLFFDGMLLEDSRTLESYDIVKERNLSVILRVESRKVYIHFTVGEIELDVDLMVQMTDSLNDFLKESVKKYKQRFPASGPVTVTLMVNGSVIPPQYFDQIIIKAYLIIGASFSMVFRPI